MPSRSLAARWSRRSCRGLRVTTARIRRHLGYIEFELGNFEQARALSQEAHELAVAIPDRAVDAMATWDLSRLDALAGDLDSAVARSLRGLDLAKGDTSTTGLITMWLGFLHIRRGELDEAASRLEARLAMPRNVHRDQEAMARLGLGDVMLARGDRQGARKRYEAAASALEKGAQQSRCIAEQRLARMDLEDGGLDQAHTRFETMLGIASTRHSPLCEAEARAGLADVAARRGNWETADAEARRVVELTEAFREAAVSLESRSLGFGALAPAYERAIEISMQRAEWGESRTCWRARWRSTSRRSRADCSIAFLEARLDERVQGPTALATERAPGARTVARAPGGAADCGTRTSRLRRRRRRSFGRPRRSRCRCATWRRASTRPIRGMPPSSVRVRSMLDGHSGIARRGHAAAGVRAGRSAQLLVGRVAARDTGVYAGATRDDRNARAPGAHEPREITAHRRRMLRTGAAPTEDSARADPHGDRARRLTTHREAAGRGAPGCALADSVWRAAALDLLRAGLTPDCRRMLMRYEIVQVPSATILGAMRSLTAGRAAPARQRRSSPIPSTRPRTRACDPPHRRFDTHAPHNRVKSPACHSLGCRSRAAKQTPSPRWRPKRSRRSLERRPPASARLAGHSTTTASSISRHTGSSTRRFSSLSSLVLSLVDGAGRPRDGFVMLPDVYDMTLNADVVVLSGCQTALGKDVRGEGPIGLARAFMYAGVPRVVASLWQVDDLATAELMKRFYRGMLVDGLPPAAALRAAQRELAGSRRWRSPYFWAPFVLQGDWR